MNISTSSNGCATTISTSIPSSTVTSRFDPATIERAYQDLSIALIRVLHGANFVEVPHDEIDRAHREDALVRVNIETPMDDYREIRFFRRGHHRETIEISEWYGWRKRRSRPTSMRTSSCW